ncbi:angiopoietin-related protein 7-like isoform X2 [Drosophila novamexicana]|uniref:angiopoietin-related protein 7-like isoform X2 n=1 Tax=Drosophila novamexicana TaxID=47314 RepID=UPI0011E5B0CB|nr:angiopoietin-related protein 7-like isoform X2 [Drosophila novamexicana]
MRIKILETSRRSASSFASAFWLLSCSVTRIAEEECGKYTYKSVRPLLKFIHQMKDEIENNNNKVEGKDREIKQLQEKLNQRNELVIEELRAQNDFYKQTIKELTSNVLLIKEEMGKLTSNAFKIKEDPKKTINEKDQRITEIKNEISYFAKKLKNYEEKIVYSECTDIADAPGIRKIKPDHQDPFNILCDSATAGPGWMVIQQRINGKENFFRKWVTYRQGFGAFDGDFFLGLEKIHRLTSARPHELYIHMEQFDGIIKYYRYEQFAIAGEVDQYKLITLGKAEGNATDDYLAHHRNMKFTTYDRDNDAWNDGNCASNHRGAWWYSYCAASNLNGKYYNYKKQGADAIFWDTYESLKKVKMLIRAKGLGKL